MQLLNRRYPVPEAGYGHAERDYQAWYRSQNLISPEMLYGSPCLRAISRFTVQQSSSRSEINSQAITPPTRPSSPVIDEALTVLRVLAVDDDAIILKLLHRYLVKGRSNTVVTVYNGLEAVDAVRNARAGSNFNLIFMDISMPAMDGFEATRLIRCLECNSPYPSANKDPTGVLRDEDDNEEEEGRRCTGKSGGARNRSYIVALTGFTDQRDQDKAEQSGFDEFWTKPILFSKIGDLLDRLNAANSLVNW